MKSSKRNVPGRHCREELAWKSLTASPLRKLAPAPIGPKIPGSSTCHRLELLAKSLKLASRSSLSFSVPACFNPRLESGCLSVVRSILVMHYFSAYDSLALLLGSLILDLDVELGLHGP